MAALFLSYSREDATRVGMLAKALEQSGHQVWWDRHIAGGAEFSDAIERALESANAVIVCWTARSIRSPWVRDEASAGRDRGCLVPVSLDGSQPPLGFRQYQTIDLSRWTGRPASTAFAELAKAVADKTGEPPESASHIVTGDDRRGRRWVLAAAAALVFAGAGALLYPQLFARSPMIEPKVAIGTFSLVSANLPKTLPAMVGQEIVAAFGAENAVTVLSLGDPKAASSPFVIDGTIGQLGPAVHFTINLKNRESGVVLWSGAYEHEAANAIAARQAAVGASQIVRCGLWGASSYKGRMSDEALSLYLKWCNEHWGGSARESSELDAARRVTVSVPDFSFGWSALALATVPLATAKSNDAEKLRTEGVAAARKATELDRQNPEGFMALAGLLAAGRFNERETLLKKALDVRPTECGCERQAYGDFLASVGRLDEAVEQYERARAMRPLAPFSNLRFAQALYMVGRNEEADRVLQSTLDLWPTATSLQLLKIKSSLWTRRYDEGIAAMQDPDLPLTSTQRRSLAAAFTALKTGVSSHRTASVTELQRSAADPRYNDKIVIGTLAALGAQEAALDAAASLIHARGLLEAEVLFEPNLATARSEPTYTALVSKLGLVDYWKSAPSQPDICREASRPPYCPAA